jgi:hypothetical protein
MVFFLRYRLLIVFGKQVLNFCYLVLTAEHFLDFVIFLVSGRGGALFEFDLSVVLFEIDYGVLLDAFDCCDELLTFLAGRGETAELVLVLGLDL